MSIKLLTIGDPHFMGTNPRAYKGSYKEDVLTHLYECVQLAYDNECSAVLMPGDLTHSHIMSMKVLREFMSVLKRFRCPVITIGGNHDRESTSLEDLNAAPYGVLQVARTIWDVGRYSFVDVVDEFEITGHPYTEQTDIDINQYCLPEKSDRNLTSIHLTHGMLLPDDPWWVKNNKENAEAMRYTTFKQLAEVPAEKRPHIIINGHFHDGHPPTFIDEKTLVVNFGSICRLTRGLNEIKRTLQVGLITIESPQRYWAESITLQSQRPGEECLSREELRREIERRKQKKAMSSYLEDMSSTRRELQVRDAREVIAQSVKELGLPDAVAERCFARLDKVANEMEAEVNA